jgi:DNA-binding NarL/FixJ family response regulator
LNFRSFEPSTESHSTIPDGVGRVSRRRPGSAPVESGVVRPCTRLLVADADGLMRAGIRTALKGSRFTVVGEAETGSKILPTVRKTAPDVVLLNLEMPELDGLACLERLTSRHPDVIVVMLATTAAPAQIRAAFIGGAQGWILKTIEAEDLGPAIAQMLAATVFHLFGPAIDSSAEARAAGLSARELETVRLVARGYSNKRIAAELWITVQTVKFHLTNVYRKLDLPNRTAAARWAHESNLLTQGAELHRTGAGDAGLSEQRIDSRSAPEQPIVCVLSP